MKILLCLPALFFLSGCDESKEPGPKISLTNSTKAIDYKKSTYKLFIGQTVDSIKKIMDFQHNYLQDDGIVNDTGVTHYMSTSENDLKVNDTEFLPTLFFTTDNRKMIEFKCSIIASPGSHSKTHILAFLASVEPLFESLRSEKNKMTLVDTYALSIDTTNYIEQFSLDTTDRKYDILFTYLKKVK